MLLMKFFGFSIQFYVFGFSRSNGLINRSFVFVANKLICLENLQNSKIQKHRQKVYDPMLFITFNKLLLHICVGSLLGHFVFSIIIAIKKQRINTNTNSSRVVPFGQMNSDTTDFSGLLTSLVFGLIYGIAGAFHFVTAR